MRLAPDAVNATVDVRCVLTRSHKVTQTKQSVVFTGRKSESPQIKYSHIKQIPPLIYFYLKQRSFHSTFRLVSLDVSAEGRTQRGRDARLRAETPLSYGHESLILLHKEILCPLPLSLSLHPDKPHSDGDSVINYSPRQ